MKLFNRYSCLLLASASLFSSLAMAVQDNELIIVNHYNKPLDFTISRNQEVLPDFPVKFVIDVQASATSKVVDIQKETYIRTVDSDAKSGFWGVDVENNKTHIHGYVSKGIAYSWKMQTITFCTPEDYKKNGSCL